MNWGLRKILGDRRGATAVEYGFILAMVVLAMMIALQLLAGEVTETWNDIADKVQKAGPH